MENSQVRKGFDLAEVLVAKESRTLQDVYKEPEFGVACCMGMSDNKGWKREVSNECCSIRKEAEKAMKMTAKHLSLKK